MNILNAIIFVVLIYLLINAIIVKYAFGGEDGKKLFVDAIKEGSNDSGATKEAFRKTMFFVAYLLALPIAIVAFTKSRKNK